MVLLPEGKANSANRANAQTGFYVILHDHIAPILHERKDTSGEFNALNDAIAVPRPPLTWKKITRPINQTSAWRILALAISCCDRALTKRMCSNLMSKLSRRFAWRPSSIRMKRRIGVHWQKHAVVRDSSRKTKATR